MGTLAIVASMFAEQVLQFLVDYIGAENISKTSDCVPDQSDSFPKCRILKQKSLQFLLYSSDNVICVRSVAGQNRSAFDRRWGLS
jgi:thiazole synthase ThiGH ThiG subunit